jgi:hypothetical protein
VAVSNGKAKCGGTESERRNASGRGQCLMTTMDISVPCNLQLQQQDDGMMSILGRGVVLLFIVDKCDPETKRRAIFLAVSVNIYERYVTVAVLGWDGLGRAALFVCSHVRSRVGASSTFFFSKTSKTLILFFLTHTGHQGP